MTKITGTVYFNIIADGLGIIKVCNATQQSPVFYYYEYTPGGPPIFETTQVELEDDDEKSPITLKISGVPIPGNYQIKAAKNVVDKGSIGCP